jgi:hypothetical protein
MNTAVVGDGPDRGRARRLGGHGRRAAQNGAEFFGRAGKRRSPAGSPASVAAAWQRSVSTEAWAITAIRRAGRRFPDRPPCSLVALARTSSPSLALDQVGDARRAEGEPRSVWSAAEGTPAQGPATDRGLARESGQRELVGSNSRAPRRGANDGRRSAGNE